MKKLVYIFSFLILFKCSFGQDWTWQKGSVNSNQNGVYGVQGLFSPTNIPGARSGAAWWKDTSGIIWMFGGEGYGSVSIKGRLSDLWKYNPATNEWAWIKGPTVINQFANYGAIGVSAPTNIPGSRYDANTWIDALGNLWLFGGYGVVSSGSQGFLNDLWKYNPTTNEWVWVSGSNILQQVGLYGTQGVPSFTNSPGCRSGACSWVDNNGDFWLFGGYGYCSFPGLGRLNDLWKYTVSTNEWTWMKGSSNFTGVNGTYGTIGIGTASTSPGGREAAVTWQDTGGSLWLFGGLGVAAASSGYLNDLWKYDISTNQWIWVNGSNISNQFSSYGLQGLPALTNMPGGRFGSISFKDALGNLWLFGGHGYVDSGNAGFLNDMWKLNITTNQWVWIKGQTITNQNGIYGILNISSPTNIPGSRCRAFGWVDTIGYFRLFGGSGYGQSGGLGSLNDMWAYSPCNSIPLPPTNTTNTINLTVCFGNQTTLTATGIGTINWFSSATATSIIGSGNSFITPNLSITTTYYIDNINCEYSNSRIPITVSVVPLPVVTISSGTNSICYGDSVTLISSGAMTYTWNNSVNSNSIVVSPTVTTTYSVLGTDSNNCINNSTIAINTMALPILNVTSSSSLVCLGNTASLTVNGASTYTWSTGSNSPTIVMSPTINSTYTVQGTNTNGCKDSISFTLLVSPCTNLIDSVLIKSEKVHVYPNPSSGFIVIEIEDFDSGKKTEAILTDINGKYVTTFLIKDHKRTILELKSGSYYIKIYNDCVPIFLNKLIIIN